MDLFRSLALLLCLIQVGLGVEPAAALDIKNFRQVNEHLFRGAQPSPVGLQELGALGIKRVIDLRERGEATSFESELLGKLGISYTNIPFRQFAAPSDDQVQAVLQLLTRDNVPTFVHCRRGKDRTGVVIACYRIQHDGWNNDKALREAKSNGMSSFERSMQSYILRFSPRPITTALLP